MPEFFDLPLIDRMVRAVELVRDRLLRATKALEDAGVPYAVIGGNAVAAWVATVDPAATRNTPDVELLVRRAEFEAIKRAMEAVGFAYKGADNINLFLDGPDGRARDAVRIAIAGERGRPRDLEAAPDVSASQVIGQLRVLSLMPLVRIMRSSGRLVDQVRLQDLLDVGLIDASWLTRFPPELAARLQHLIDTPEG